MSDLNSRPDSPFRNTQGILLLILAGEAVFFLPFAIARIFRPTFLAVFDLTNLELGLAYSVYGLIAIPAYLLGGPIADRFPVNRIMAVALGTTAVGGFYMAQIPDFTGLRWLYGAWGITTILLFWAALIRATREWGGQQGQGIAFGLLDGGRGVLAAGIGTLGVWVFARTFPDSIENATLAEKTAALQTVILWISGYVGAVALLVWWGLGKGNTASKATRSSRITWEGVKKVGRLPTVWLQAIIIVCAYVGYKATDDYSLLAQEVMGMNEVEAASIGTLSFWVRPVMAILAGWLGDRFQSTAMVGIAFGMVAVGASAIGLGILEPGATSMLFLVIITTSGGIFALRGLYFAISQEGRVPLMYMGTAVGLMSVIGYTPDIFMGPLMGYLLDRSPGPVGHQHVFWVLAAFSLLGMLATYLFNRISKKLAPLPEVLKVD